MYTRIFFALVILFFITEKQALAEAYTCEANIKGQNKTITFDSDDEYIENATFRQIFRSAWDNSCPGFIVLRQLTPSLTAAERGAFCAEYDKNTKSFLGISQGERNAYGECKNPGKICKAVNASKKEALAIVGIGATASGGTTAGAALAGVTAVTHSSGAVILTGSAGYLAGTLGTVAASVVSILTAPVTIIGATVSVIAVGSAVFICN